MSEQVCFRCGKIPADKYFSGLKFKLVDGKWRLDGNARPMIDLDWVCFSCKDAINEAVDKCIREVKK